MTKFEDIDWVNNEEWQLYLKNLYPTPPASRIHYFKQKWYQKNIDKSYVITPESVPTQQSTSSTTSPPSTRQADTTSSSQQSRSPAAINSLERISTVLLCGAVLLSLGSFVPTSLAARLRYAALSLFMFGSCAHICGTVGIPKFRTSYWERVFYSDAGQAIMMTFLALVIGSQVSLTMLSPMLSGLVMASEGLSKLVLHPTIRQYSQMVQNSKYSLLQTQSDIEVILGIFIFLLGLAGRVNFLSGLVYWNVLRTKYAINGFTKSTFGKFDGQIRSALSHHMVPKMMYTIYDKVAHALRRFGNPGQ